MKGRQSMFKLIRNGRTVSDGWRILALKEGEAPHDVRLPVGPVLVPLAVWQARRAELIHREYEHGWPLGIWLAAEEEAKAIGRDLDDFTVIAVEFDKFSDGNSYRTARLLREHYGYTGELRAIGDVPRERLAFQHQVGFDTFYVRADQKIGTIMSGFSGISAANQTEARLQHAALLG
jgi:uncharacterized protein (DUF934 family)